MKLKEGFVLREVAGSWVVLPTGEATVDFNGMLSLNDSGALLWRALENGADKQGLVDALLAEYEVEASLAEADVAAFLDKLASAGCLED